MGTDTNSNPLSALLAALLGALDGLDLTSLLGSLATQEQ